jgi:hypothetical protein
LALLDLGGVNQGSHVVVEDGVRVQQLCMGYRKQGFFANRLNVAVLLQHRLQPQEKLGRSLGQTNITLESLLASGAAFIIGKETKSSE